MIRLFAIPLSTNVERVSLALGYKGIKAETILLDPDDRSRVRKISGQDLVPVIQDGDRVVSDSTEILRYLEERYPDKPLYPQEPARRAELEIFIDWFNRVWKRPPNELEKELSKHSPDRERVERLGQQMTRRLDLFEAMLTGRQFLMGEFSAADCAAFPFLKYALIHPDGDPYLFHKVLVDYQPLGQDHPALAAWIRRVDDRPRA